MRPPPCRHTNRMFAWTVFYAHVLSNSAELDVARGEGPGTAACPLNGLHSLKTGL